MSTNRRIFLKQLGLTAVGATVLMSNAENLYASNNLKVSLPRSTPELQGMSSAGIQSFLTAIENSKIEFHSIMIVRHGHVVAEGWWSPYAPDLKHTLYSLSKSFTSTAVGMAIAEGKFSLDSKVVSFFPGQLPEVISTNLAAMNVQHLLEMASGHDKDTIPPMRTGTDDDWIKIFLGLPVEHEPGTHFVYNTGATYMLSAIVQKVTYQPLEEYLKTRLFDPLGIDDFDWEKSPQRVNTGGYGLRVHTEDIAKFGQLYLQKGKWKGKQIIPAEWIADATASHVDNSPAVHKIPKEVNDWSQGYGYQFWRCTHNAFRGDGAFGQFCIMMPEQDVVVAITGESFNLQQSIGLVWSDLLPAIKPKVLPANVNASKALSQQLKALAITPPKYVTTSPVVQKIDGKQFTLAANEFNASKIFFIFGKDSALFSVTTDKGESRIFFGNEKWKEEKNSMTQQLFPMKGRPVVSTPTQASGTWIDPLTLQLSIRYTATAHSDEIFFTFIEDNVNIRFLNSVSKGNKDSVEKRMEIKGALG
ncbi:hypothetical protein BH09BAC3_BH09BAC3_31960 [soil metagenome]